MTVRSAAAFSVPAFFVLFLLLVAGCATTESTTKKSTEQPAPRATTSPRYNLTGYSPSFKAGYADACGTPRRRSDARFKTDDEYRMGWQDGVSMCKTAR